MPTIRTETTPNPNSLKFTTDDGAFLDAGMEAFTSPDEAQGHPLGERLFDVDAVVDVFITPQFVTVSKHPDADWEGTAATITEALNDHLKSPHD